MCWLESILLLLTPSIAYFWEKIHLPTLILDLTASHSILQYKWSPKVDLLQGDRLTILLEVLLCLSVLQKFLLSKQVLVILTFIIWIVSWVLVVLSFTRGSGIPLIKKLVKAWVLLWCKRIPHNVHLWHLFLPRINAICMLRPVSLELLQVYLTVFMGFH
jgi:hypothetical protein